MITNASDTMAKTNDHRQTRVGFQAFQEIAIVQSSRECYLKTVSRGRLSCTRCNLRSNRFAMLTRWVRQSMRLAAWFGFITIAAANISAPAHAQRPDDSQGPDDSLRIYAVNVVHSRPLKEPFTGYGIYLGQGAVITAAHILGRWPSFISNPRVLISGQELPAKIIKEGSVETIDLALLTVDETRLPISLRLRRNPLCKEPPKSGENVIVVLSYGTARSQIIFPQLLPPQYRTNFDTFISDVSIAGGSGSGVFHADRKCLLGILTSKIWNYNYQIENGRLVRNLARSTIDIARQFVPASKIAEFIPPNFRF
jgi:hypothetical protein